MTEVDKLKQKPKRLRSSGKGRGWNFRRGAKDAVVGEEARRRGRNGGLVRPSEKGFDDIDKHIERKIEEVVAE